MSKKSLLLILAVGFCAISSAHAATIVWVSDNKTPNASTLVPADQGWVDLLVNTGYTVDLSFRNKEGRTLDATKIAALNAADLIIISRDTSSGDYDDGQEPTQWNSVTTPIIMQVAHIARSAHWRWVNTTGTNDALPTLQAVATNHYVFRGVTLGANGQVGILTTNSSFASTTDAGNGTLIAKRANNDQVWIVEWQPGQPFYAGSTQTPAGPRMLFLQGTVGSPGDGAYNLTAEGQKMFLNAVTYMLGETGKAMQPDPAGAQEDVVRDVVLRWATGENVAEANGHVVYFSDSRDNVVNGVGGVTLSTNSYAVPELLNFGTTYYWRVDQVEAAPSSRVYKGDIWSFTTEPSLYRITDIQATAESMANANTVPANTVNGSGLTQAADGQWVHDIEEKTMWQSATPGLPATIAFEFDGAYKLAEMKVWNHNSGNEEALGIGAREVTIEVADSNSGPWVFLADVTLNKALGLPDAAATDTIPLNGVVASNVRLTIRSNHSTYVLPTTGLAEVQFFYIPVVARELAPSDGTTLTSAIATFTWRSGREASEHQVYMDPNRALVAESSAAALVATIPAQGSYASYAAPDLTLSQTYYWKVVEVNAAETPADHNSPIRRFTTPAFESVDDMEGYRDEAFREIWATWLDGTEYGTNDPTNGSMVGLNPAAGDYRVAPGRTGGQSLPIWYNNTAAAPKSEAVRTPPFGNWTAHGIKSLSLWFCGDSANSGGRLYVRINNGTPLYYDGDAGDIKKNQWLPFNIDLSNVAGGVSNVTKLSVGVEGAGNAGVIQVDDIRLYPRAPEYVTPVQPDTANLLAYYDFEGNANDRSGHGLNGTVVNGQLASPGKLGQGLGLQVNDAGYVDLGNPPVLDFGTGNWTVTAWFKTAMEGIVDDAFEGTIYGKGGDNTGGKRCAFIMNQNTPGVLTLVCDDDVNRRDANSRTITNDDQWHFVAGQREGAVIKIYIDGLLEGTNNAVGAAYDLSGTSQHKAYIGALTDNRDGTIYKTFTGSIDEVRIYDRALSDAEIAGLAGKTAPAPKPF